MSAATHPIRGVVEVAGTVALVVLSPIAAGALVVGGWVSTLAGSAALWTLAYRLTRPPRPALVLPKPWEVDR